MSLEKSIEELVKAITILAGAIKHQTASILERIAGEPAPDPSAKGEVGEEFSDSKYSIDDLRNFAGILVKTDQLGGYDAALEILNEFNCKRFDELDSSNYYAVAKKFEAAIKKLKKKAKKGSTLG